MSMLLLVFSLLRSGIAHRQHKVYNTAELIVPAVKLHLMHVACKQIDTPHGLC